MRAATRQSVLMSSGEFILLWFAFSGLQGGRVHVLMMMMGGRTARSWAIVEVQPVQRTSGEQNSVQQTPEHGEHEHGFEHV